jgi:hypothetical protein
MKQKSKRITFEAFSELILQQPLDKIENVLAIASPCDGFRDSLIRMLWHFYCNNGPRVWNSRAVLKNALRKSAQLATELQELAHLLGQSRDPAVLKILIGLVEWQAWQSSRPTHESGIAWIALLDEFAKRTDRLADKLADDRGGARQAIAFDELLVGLATYYRTLCRERDQPLHGIQFVEFAEAVTNTLRKVRPQLPDGTSLKLPPGKEALRKRLLRLNKKRSRRQPAIQDITTSFFG